MSEEQCEQMIAWMAERFVERSVMDKEEALDYAHAIFHAQGADEDVSYTKDSAYKLADTDISYWEN